MGCKIKESDIKELQREILCKCRRRAECIVPCYEEADDICQEEDIRDVDTSSSKDNGITKEELPFEEILAEKRRKYTAKEDFIYLLYNDILPAFVTKWEGYFLRKKPSTMHKSDVEIDDVNVGEDEEIHEPYVNDVSLIKEGKEEAHVLSWKLSLPDEFADISFYNNNSYSGRISRKMMEGEGTYKWHDGVQYKAGTNWYIINLELG
ncbi:uncharacterized protein LOC116852217 [Odontomachus brunneus]|uniref:uncharacterized protein LOC116852217 n=1 Tax=Odontomachus brunneus TaxID=486640 RepID=UPI0013F1EDE3|nr:uncharacterized protein LOC116852217 [Odontomachus brunneus]